MKTAQFSPEESREILQAIIKATKDALVIADAEDKVLVWSQSAEEMFGYHPDEIIGQKLHQIIPVQIDHEKYKKDMSEFAQTGKNWVTGGVFELPVKKKSGIEFVVELSVASAKIHGAWHAIGIMRDVTERLRQAKKEKVEKKRYEMLAKLSQVKVGSLQELLDFALEEAIELTESKLGYVYYYDETRKEFTLNSWSKSAMEECAITNRQTVYQLDKTGFWGEVVRQRKPIINNNFQSPNPLKKGYPKGHVELLKYLSVPVYHLGKIVAVAAVANKEKDYEEEDVAQLILLMDSIWKIVEQKKMEQEARRLAAIVESADDVILSKTLEGIIISWNKGAEELYGYLPEEVVGKNVEILLPNDRKTESLEILSKIKQGEKVNHYETIRVKKDGTPVDVSVTVSPIRDSEGNIVGASTIARDVTKQKQMIRDLEKMNKLMVGRELKMIELKEKIKELEKNQ